MNLWRRLKAWWRGPNVTIIRIRVDGAPDVDLAFPAEFAKQTARIRKLLAIGDAVNRVADVEWRNKPKHDVWPDRNPGWDFIGWDFFAELADYTLIAEWWCEMHPEDKELWPCVAAHRCLGWLKETFGDIGVFDPLT